MTKIIPFGIIWGFFGFLYPLIEYGILGDAEVYPSTNNPYAFGPALIVITSSTVLMGLLLGTVEVLWLTRLFKKRSFWQKILFKAGLYLFSILVLLLSTALIMNSLRMSLPAFHPAVLETIFLFVNNFAFWSIVIYSGTITVVTLFIMEVSDYLGGSVFNNFFTGRYHRPRVEERIFMFLDMKSSTTIAEQLGHVTYFQLLNQYYADTTDAIIETYGEVYQYAGDEIIISWDLKQGLANNHCIECFFKIRETFQLESEQYLETFGLVPEFKAGFHFGKVTTGEIGVLKKEIFFTGDVMNTTARIQSKCNEFDTDILLSGTLVSKLDLAKGYELFGRGEHLLKGRKEKIALFSIAKNN